MPNDPTKQTVDWPGVEQADNATNAQSEIKTSPNPLIGIETATKDGFSVENETFTNNSKEKK